MKRLTKTQIIAAGAAIPPQRVKSDDLLASIKSEQRFGVPHDFISKKVGIIERRVADKLTMPSDLAVEASIDAMSKCDVHPLDIDVIIFCGISRDWVEPSTAHRVQDILGAKNAFCFDITNACHGMMNGLDYADSKIQSGKVETVLICTGEKPSEFLDYAIDQLNNRDSFDSVFKECVGYFTAGDAGGAFIVRRGNGATGLESMAFYSYGEHAKLCHYSRTEQGVFGQMLMKEISDEIHNAHAAKILEAYQSLNWSPENIDHLIVHQVGKGLTQSLAETANIKPEKMSVTYAMLGNIASATIPVAIALTPYKTNDRMLVLSSGSGLCIGQSGLVCSHDNTNSVLNIRSPLDHCSINKTVHSI